jgi:hypothetical protein
MPTNLTKKYNQLLELLYGSERDNLSSFRRVFDRDFGNGIVNTFRGLPVEPTTADGEDAMDRLFRHLTTVILDKKTRKRAFEGERSIRVHWIKHHLEEKCALIIFRVEDEKRVYILDKVERYVIVLEPKRNNESYYLLTAYKLQSSSYKKIMKKRERRGTSL